MQREKISVLMQNLLINIQTRHPYCPYLMLYSNKEVLIKTGIDNHLDNDQGRKRDGNGRPGNELPKYRAATPGERMTEQTTGGFCSYIVTLVGYLSYSQFFSTADR